MSADLPQRLRAAWLALSQPPPGLVVAVSGGPDSVALWRGLADVRPAGVPLLLAHLHHGLRGSDADADAAFVAALAPDGFVGERLDVAALAKEHGDNLPAAARRARYRWLADVARRHGLAFVATGHTADDQAETVLHHLLRGTGLAGLRGIAQRRRLGPGVEAFRPLLSVTRAEVLEYLHDLGQPARHDASNDDVTRTRNRIRHELLPLLARHYNPRVAAALCRLAAQADDVWRDEERAAAELLARAELPRAGSLVVLDAETLAAAPRRLVRAAFRLLWHREGWPMGQMGFAEYERLADLAGALDLPGGVRARRRARVIQLGP